jgi:pimeloyl-ACP methyl ester carboxylesterase
VFVGWSLGGHVLLEASERLPSAAGFLVFGTPPIASNAHLPKALSSDPAIGAAFREDSTDEEVLALLAMFFRPGSAIPAQFVEDFRRTDKRCRSAVAAAVARNELLDEVRIVERMARPLAVLHGAQDAVARRHWIESLSIPTLWRGSVQGVPDAGHAAQWENPETFNRLLSDFVVDCTRHS